MQCLSNISESDYTDKLRFVKKSSKMKETHLIESLFLLHNLFNQIGSIAPHFILFVNIVIDYGTYGIP